MKEEGEEEEEVNTRGGGRCRQDFEKTKVGEKVDERGAGGGGGRGRGGGGGVAVGGGKSRLEWRGRGQTW